MPPENGQTCDALDVQYIFLKLAQKHLAGTDEETDWLIERWGFTLDAIRSKPEALIGGVDWISKKYLLDTFRAEENLGWHDPWLQSLDLEYHNINPAKGLFFALTPAKTIGEFNDGVRSDHALRNPPSNTRARDVRWRSAIFRRRINPTSSTGIRFPAKTRAILRWVIRFRIT